MKKITIRHLTVFCALSLASAAFFPTIAVAQQPHQTQPPTFDLGGAMAKGLFSGLVFFVTRFWYVIVFALGVTFLRFYVDGKIAQKKNAKRRQRELERDERLAEMIAEKMTRRTGRTQE